jgi:hypothetical protein
MALKLVKKKPMSDDDHLRNNKEIENALDKRDIKVTRTGGKTYITIPTSEKQSIKFEVTET